MPEQTQGQNVGKVIEVKGVVIDALFPDELPEIYSAFTDQWWTAKRSDRRSAAAPGRRPRRGVALGSTDGLARGMDVVDPGGADHRAGRQGDARAAVERDRRAARRERRRPTARALADPPRPARPRLSAEDRSLRNRHQGHRPDRPFATRRQDRAVRRGGSARPCDPGADPQHRHGARRFRRVRGCGGAHAGGNDLWLEMQETRRGRQGGAGLRTDERAAGCRLRVGLSALTMAEYFRDEGRDVLLFIDNIFRFVQAGSEVSALLGRMPSAVGYQPTLGTEMGQLQERIASTQHGSITSVQAVYVPADDLTDPAPATTSPTSMPSSCSSARSPTRASTRRSTRWHRPRVLSTRRSSARSTTTSARGVQGCCSATRTCRTSSRSSAWTS